MPVINPSPAAGVVPGEGADFGPCDTWPIEWTCDLAVQNPALTGIAVSTATEVLWALSGMRFGLCNVTLRPCRRECTGGLPDDFGPPWDAGWYPRPALIGGLWFNLSCGGCLGECSCTTVSEFALPAPVHEIIEIKVDGTPLVSGAYRLDNNRIVVRTDGGEWPRCNDLSRDDTETDTWSVTATYGEVVPEAAKLAMGQLACEIIRAAGGGDCKLPAGLQQLVRQGVTISYPDVGELFRQGRTGLYLVDMFLAAWNPYNLRQRSRVYSVDRPTVRRAGT
jgi:hypothetical protein